MKAVVQRVFEARVTVDGLVVGAIDKGLIAFVGVGAEDEPRDGEWLADKLCKLRIFTDELGKMSRAVSDVGGRVLLVSQFTLFGDVSRGNRPSFIGAKEPEVARRLFDEVVQAVERRVPGVAVGRFGADMRVSVENDGPVTILLDSRRPSCP